MPLESKVKAYRFRTTLFGRQILEVGIDVRHWDSYTCNFDPPIRQWRKATRWEADKLLTLIKEK